MKSIMKNDKVILIKDFEGLVVGKKYEVANILDDGTVIIRDDKSKIAKGAISVSDYYTYFAKEIKSWTQWIKLVNSDNSVIAWYRTNGRKVQVRTNDGFRGEASCNKNDIFDLFIGIGIAINRAILKYCDATCASLITEYSDKIDSFFDLERHANKEMDYLIKTIKSKAIQED